MVIIMSFKFCPKCGYKFEKEYKFCPECGEKFVPKDDKKQEPLFDFSDDTESYEDTSFGGFDKMLNDQQKVAEEMESIKRANVLCVRGEFDEAEKLVSLFIDRNYDRIEGYVALLRVHSKDYTLYEGAQIEKDLRVIQKIVGSKQINDNEYNGYVFARKRYFDDKKAEEAARKKAEAERKAKAEEATRRKAEAERKAAEEAARRKAEAERRAAEEAARRRAEAERKAAEETARRRAEAERKAAEEAARRRAEAERKAAEEAARRKAEAERKAAEEAARKKEEENWNKAEKLYSAGKYVEAVPILKTLAENGRVEAQFYLGYCYNKGYGVPADSEKTIFWYRKAADKGHKVAQYNLGICFENGDCVNKDTSLAIFWYIKSANLGYAPAQCSLARCYEYGIGVEIDYETAENWCRKAAAQGHSKAKEALERIAKKAADAEARRIAEEEKRKKAKEEENAWNAVKRGWSDAVPVPRIMPDLMKFAEKGKMEAQYLLGRSYRNGFCVPKDDEKAAYWLTKAGEQGHKDASFVLGCIYEKGVNKQHPDYKQAAYWFQKSVDQGFVSALTDFARVNKKVEEADAVANLKSQAANDLTKAKELYKAKKYAEAVALLKKYAEGDSAEVNFYLGTCYENGKGVPKDHSKAFILIRQAADQGLAEAQFYIGELFEKSKQYFEASKYYSDAAEQDYPGAAKAVERVGKKISKAHKW